MSVFSTTKEWPLSLITRSVSLPDRTPLEGETMTVVLDIIVLTPSTEPHTVSASQMSVEQVNE